MTLADNIDVGKLLIQVFIPLILLVFGFQNCSDVGFTESQESLSLPPPPINDDLGVNQDSDYGVIDASCESGAAVTQSIKVTFGKPQAECAWEQNGNMSVVDGKFRARIKQTQNLGLPYGAVICDASFDFKVQDFKYDDYFAFLFNDQVISSGYNFTGFLSEGNFDLQTYNWNDIRNVDMDFDGPREQVYCPQISQGQITCDFPGHDTAGQIDFDMDKRYIRAIMSNGVPADHSFSMVTFGDNNEWDCEHSGVEFDVTVSYVITDTSREEEESN